MTHLVVEAVSWAVYAATAFPAIKAGYEGIKTLINH